MMNRKVGAAVCVVVLAVVAGVYLSSRPRVASGKEIRLGAVLPLTGTAGNIGEWQRNGIDLALEDAGAGEQGGRHFRVIYEDSAGVAKTGVSAFTKLADTISPTLVISSLSAVSNAVLPLSDARKLPLIMISVSYPGIALRSPWAFRNHPGSEDEARTIADFWIRETPVRRVAVFYVNDDFGEGAQKAFGESFRAAGGKVAWQDAYGKDAVDFRSLIAAAKESTPEGLYVIGYVDATVRLLRQIRQMGMRQPLASNMAMSTPLYLEMAGEALDGAYFSVPSFTFEKEKPGTPAAKFCERYRAKYGKEADVFAAMAYDVVGMVAAILKGKEPSPEVIQAGLSRLSQYPAAMGSLTMSAERTVLYPLEVAVLKQGRLARAAK